MNLKNMIKGFRRARWVGMMHKLLQITEGAAMARNHERTGRIDPVRTCQLIIPTAQSQVQMRNRLARHVPKPRVCELRTNPLRRAPLMTMPMCLGGLYATSLIELTS